MDLKQAILVLIVTLLHRFSSEEEEKFKVTPLDNNEVIYLETLSKVKMYHEQWKIVVGYDLIELKRNYDVLNDAYIELQKKCQQVINGMLWACSSIKRITKRLERHQKIANELENVLYLAGLKSETRFKRGLFDFVGEASKTLFGTLSDSDAAYYNSELDKLHSDQKRIIQYVRNQTSIILKSVSTDKKTLTTTAITINRINEQFNRVRNLTQANEANIIIDEAILDLDEEHYKLINEIKNTEDLIVDGRHGTIKPYILTPKELFETLRAHKHIDNFPTPLEEIYYTTLIDVSEISIVLSEKRLLVQILIPLIEDKILELTKVISLPKHGWLSQSIIDTSQGLILLDPLRIIFMPIDESDLASTKNLGEYRLLKRNHPDYRLGIKDNCLTEILTKHDTGKCTTKYMQIQNTLWIQLHTDRDWIGIAPKEEIIHIICSDKIPRKVKIYQNFVFHLEPDCTVISETATLRPSNLHNNKIEIHKTIRIVDQESINETLAQHQLTDIPIDLIQETHVDPENLQKLGKTLDELDDIAEKIATHQRTITWKERFLYYLQLSGYIALGSILFVFLYKIRLFSSIIKLFKQLIGNCYSHCSFNNRAPTQHVSYTTRQAPQLDVLTNDINPDLMRRLLHKI